MLKTIPIYIAFVFACICSAQSDAFVGQLMLFGGNFEPKYWAFCDGRLLSIPQYPALFSLLGTTYGGNGQTTFGLPDLRGRVPRGMGQGPGLFNVQLGQTGGQETTQLTGSASGAVQIQPNNLPPHSHPATFAGTSSTTSFTSTLDVVAGPGGANVAAGNLLSQGSNAGTGAANIFVSSAGSNPVVAINGGKGSISSTPAGTVNVANSAGNGAGGANPLTFTVPFGGHPPFNIQDPYLGMNWVICLQGIFPSRN